MSQLGLFAPRAVEWKPRRVSGGRPGHRRARPRNCAADRVMRMFRDAVRSHCAQCMGGCAREVSRCTAPGCPLYPLRSRAAEVASRRAARSPAPVALEVNAA
jgi:hypothetical protein